MTPPILFIVFNRPETTARVFEKIRQARPSRLYVAADGPRAEYPTDKHKCEAVRKIATAVDWPCDVQILLRPENLGCMKGVSGGIDWFFAHEKSGIVLEDDIVPTPAFFSFCENMLEEYRDNSNIYAISGINIVPRKSGPKGHFQSRYFQAWGWAGWADRWNEMDITLPDFREKLSKARKQGKIKWWEAKRWRGFVASALRAGYTWDYQWMFFILTRGGGVIRPTANLIKNIGFGEDATHTKKPDIFTERLETVENYATWMERKLKLRPFEDFRFYVYRMRGGPINFIKQDFVNRIIRKYFGKR